MQVAGRVTVSLFGQQVGSLQMTDRVAVLGTHSFRMKHRQFGHIFDFINNE